MGLPPKLPGCALGARILARSDALGVTPSDVADAAGIQKSTLYRIIGGLTPHPRLSTLKRIARAIGVPVVDLLHEEQLELDLTEGPEPDHAMSYFRLLQGELRAIGAEDLQLRCAEAMTEVLLQAASAAKGAVDSDQFERVLSLSRGAAGGRSSTAEALEALRQQLERVPEAFRGSAVTAAYIRALDLRLAAGETISAHLYASAGDLRRARRIRRQILAHLRSRIR